METQVINISLPAKLLKLADEVAQKEARSRSELFREAIRSYVLKRSAWDKLLSYGEEQTQRLGITENGIEGLLTEYRSGKGETA